MTKHIGDNICLVTRKSCRDSFKRRRYMRQINPYFCACCQLAVRGIEIMEFTLKEAVAHTELIKVYNCKICGRTITVNKSKLDLIVTLRNNGVCPQCQFVLNWVETHGGQLPTIDAALR